jgi:hypothetical protein
MTLLRRTFFQTTGLGRVALAELLAVDAPTAPGAFRRSSIFIPSTFKFRSSTFPRDRS